MISNEVLEEQTDTIERAEDRRDAPRTDIAGRYTMRLDPCDGRDAVTCTVLDYSVTGARLQLQQDIELPASLQVVIGTLSHNARIVWRSGTVIGIDFVDEHHSLF